MTTFGSGATVSVSWPSASGRAAMPMAVARDGDMISAWLVVFKVLLENEEFPRREASRSVYHLGDSPGWLTRFIWKRKALELEACGWPAARPGVELKSYWRGQDPDTGDGPQGPRCFFPLSGEVDPSWHWSAPLHGGCMTEGVTVGKQFLVLGEKAAASRCCRVEATGEKPAGNGQ